MNRLLLLGLCFLPVLSISAPIYLARYGIAQTFVFTLYDATDGSLDIDEIDGDGVSTSEEVTVHCDEDAGALATASFVDEGTFYSISLTAAETSCARITLSIAATDLEVLVIHTYGSPLSQHPGLGW